MAGPDPSEHRPHRSAPEGDGTVDGATVEDTTPGCATGGSGPTRTGRARVRLEPVAIGPDSSIGAVAFGVLTRHFLAMVDHEPGTRRGVDPEELHDMRVATRRLRSTLALFADVLPPVAHHLRQELAWVAGALGAVRDLDVQRERLASWLDHAPSPHDRQALAGLQRLVDGQRAHARQHLLATLSSPRYGQLVEDMATMLRAGPPADQATAGRPAVLVAPGMVRARHRAALAAARRARRSGAPGDFHRLRIRCKHLRYTLESFADVYSGATVRFTARLARLQDRLGRLQDAEVAQARLRAQVDDDDLPLARDTVFAMGMVAERYRIEAARLLERLPRATKVLTGPRWVELDSLLARRQAGVAGQRPTAGTRRRRTAGAGHPACEPDRTGGRDLPGSASPRTAPGPRHQDRA